MPRRWQGRSFSLLADDGLRREMGERAAEDAVRRFGVERVVREYLAFYRATLKEESI
jgi:glycosyltransferase involved in cell wall biosynthesis